jgi:hypothetical protein
VDSENLFAYGAQRPHEVSDPLGLRAPTVLDLRDRKRIEEGYDAAIKEMEESGTFQGARGANVGASAIGRAKAYSLSSFDDAVKAAGDSELVVLGTVRYFGAKFLSLDSGVPAAGYTVEKPWHQIAWGVVEGGVYGLNAGIDVATTLLPVAATAKGIGGVNRTTGVAIQPAEPSINWGKQGKHILEHNNYKPGRSLLTADPTVLARRAGRGQQVGPVRRGEPGFKERVDFGEVIGQWVNDKTGEAQPTTVGIITYDGDGSIHIIPVRPNT